MRGLKDKPRNRELAKFLVVYPIYYAISIGVTVVALSWLNGNRFAGADLDWLLPRLVYLAILAVITCYAAHGKTILALIRGR